MSKEAPLPVANGFSEFSPAGSSSLEFPLGGDEQVVGVYKDIHDCRERGSQQRGKPKYEEHTSDEMKTVQWDALLPQLKLTGLAYELASNCIFKQFQNNRFELILSANHAALFNEKTQARIAEALSKQLNESIKLTIHIGSTAQETPAEKAKRVSKEQHDAAVKAVRNDFHVQTLIEKLSVNLDPALIEAIE